MHQETTTDKPKGKDALLFLRGRLDIFKITTGEFPEFLQKVQTCSFVISTEEMGDFEIFTFSISLSLFFYGIEGNREMEIYTETFFLSKVFVGLIGKKQLFKKISKEFVFNLLEKKGYSKSDFIESVNSEILNKEDGFVYNTNWEYSPVSIRKKLFENSPKVCYPPDHRIF